MLFRSLTKILLYQIVKKREKFIKEELKKNKISSLNSSTLFFSENQSISEMIKKKQVDVLVLSPLDYYEIKDKNLVKPIFLSDANIGLQVGYYLVVNVNTNFSNIKDLKDKRIIHVSKFENLLKNWILSMINNSNILDINQYFSHCKVVDKSSQALLPVLFGQADACVIDKGGYSLNNEMNPLLKKKLKIIAVSPGFPRTIICLRANYESEMLSHEIIDVISNLHKESEGMQIIKLFNIEKLVKFDDVHTRDLITMMEQLSRLYNGRNKKGKK